ncbi:MAG: DUF11 domain-containing protein [Pirellulaceae bacterium]
MFKSKKRWLLLSIGSLTLAAAGTAAVGVGRNYFDLPTLVGKSADESPTSAANPPAAPAADATTSPGAPNPTEFGAAPKRPPVGGELAGDSPARYPSSSPSVYPADDQPPTVRFNDDGSYRPGAAAPVQAGLQDASPSPANPSPPTPTPAGGDFGGGPPSSQRFLPPAPAPMPADDGASATQSVVSSSRLRRSVDPPADPSAAYGSAGDNGVASDNGGAPVYAAGGEQNVPFDNRPRATAPVSAPPVSAPPARFEGGYGRSLADAGPSDAASGYGRQELSEPGYGASYNAAPATGGGAAEPGPKQLEGVQSPSLTIEKIAPPEIQVGRQTTFTIKVRNVGQADAERVVVFDQPPRGTRYVGSSPEAARAPDGSLMWQIGSLKPGEESTIAMQLVPQQEGQIGSVAQVAFAAHASASTICTKPLLTVEQSGPSSVLIGESVNLTITITNPGTGVAAGVTLEEDVPDGLSHAAGNELEYELGDLRPGESRKLELTLKADKPGLISNLLVVRGEGNLVAEDRLELEVIAPQLDVALTGPSKRYLERQATYSVRVQNPGTAPATNIELVAYLPKGLKYVSTDNQGQYDAQNHAVYWSLEELPPRMNGEVTVTALPVETGQQKLRVEGRGDLGLSAAYDQQVTVEGLAELFFQVADSADPIEVDSETEYEIRLINQGSKTDTNVRVSARLPFELKPISGDGPTRVQIQGQDIFFEPLARLAPKDSAVFKVRVQGKAMGDHRISVSVVSDEVPKAVTKEESTRVYLDQ